MQYKRVEIDLAEERNDAEIRLGGNFTNFIIVKADHPFEYKINSRSGDTLYSAELQGFQGEGVFHTLYLTNETRTGKAVLVVF